MKNEVLRCMRLGQLATLQSLLVIAATFLIGFGSVYSALGSWLEQNAQTLSQGFAQAIGDNLGALSAEVERFLADEARALQMLDRDAPRGTLDREISALTRLNPLFGATVLLDTKGALLATSSSNIAAPGARSQNSLKQMASACIAGSAGPISGNIAGAPALFFVHLLTRSGKIPAGCIIAIMPTGANTPFAGRLRLLLPHGNLQAYATNADGQVLFRYLQNTETSTTPNDTTAQAQQLRENPTPASFDRNHGQLIEGRATVPDLRWEIVIQHSKAPLLASRLAWFKHAFLIALGPFLLILLISTYFLRRLSHPLAELANTIGAVEEQEAEGGVNHENYASTARRIREIHCWYREACLIKNTLLKRIDAIHGKMRDLRESAQLDELTQLANRRALTETLKKLAEGALPFAIIALDIDFFKRINDRYGYPTGDAVLRAVAGRLRGQLRMGDQAFRSGGEAFIILLPGADEVIAQRVAHRINHDIYELSILGDERITLSAGIAVWTQGSAASALGAADKALYLAKARGRNGVTVHANADDSLQNDAMIP